MRFEAAKKLNHFEFLWDDENDDKVSRVGNRELMKIVVGVLPKQKLWTGNGQLEPMSQTNFKLAYLCYPEI